MGFTKSKPGIDSEIGKYFYTTKYKPSLKTFPLFFTFFSIKNEDTFLGRYSFTAFGLNLAITDC